MGKKLFVLFLVFALIVLFFAIVVMLQGFILYKGTAEQDIVIDAYGKMICQMVVSAEKGSNTIIEYADTVVDGNKIQLDCLNEYKEIAKTINIVVIQPEPRE